MGAWGVAILSDDVAEDVSFRYKDLLGDNYSNEEASKIVIEEFQNELDDEEITTFWLSFALIQWKLGRLQEQVKNKALQIIDSGADLERWEEDPKLKKKREAVLLKLKEQLNSPQPKANKVPKRFVTDTDLKAGDAISYQLLSGDYIILKVIGIIEQWTGDKYPLFEICDWQGKVIPSKEKINQLELKNGNQELKALSLFPAGKRDNPTKRIKAVAEEVRIILDMEAPSTLLTWKEFDDELKKFYHFD
ncbi:hypothetical protein BACCIP111899_01007 [Bacillus rhizoplanae]|uniref:DUF4259 domain-containing protein n=1 Tax=Bacillus rhizoplanae TaxID=2880966 RepID=A0ABM8Y7V8_9BACI|nr:hypothetical protein [Bacillus rhizoplanae]CAG9611835.1 hypothetical protein BACCIP111899_01007 [Bacillus rhizoplanae]